MKIYSKAANVTTVLELDEKEALLVYRIFARIGGSPNGPRGVINKISVGMYNANPAIVEYDGSDGMFTKDSAGIYFAGVDGMGAL